MREKIIEVIELQRRWASTNTPEMQRRGILIRDEIPNALRSLEPALRLAIGHGGDDLMFEGRDGTGQKSEIPWVRFSSASRSPSAQTGWYVVLLFHAKGNGLYLWLGHGSTRLSNNTFVPRPDSEVAELVAWGRTVLDQKGDDPYLSTVMDLGSDKPLAKAYQRSRLAGVWYPADGLPSDDDFAKDCIAMAGLLGRLYDAGDLGREPHTVASDVLLAEQLPRLLASSGRALGQGFGLSGPERLAVEKHAMKLVRGLLVADGYEVEDVSAKLPVDFIARRGDELLHVEVKGTTGPAGSILLTRNEVQLHRDVYPRNALIVVHGIDLDRKAERPAASGGSVLRLEPWSLDDARLQALSFQYKLT